MKRLVSAVCACGLALLIAGCSEPAVQEGGSQTDQQDNAATTVSQAEPEKPAWWPEGQLASKLPYPTSSEGEVKTETDRTLQIYVNNSSLDDARSYIEACKSAGYTVDAYDNGLNYEAYSSDGYELRVYPHEDDMYYVINLDAPREMSELSWPTSGPATLVPAPPSAQAYIDVDSPDYINYLVGDMGMDAFDAYASACKEAGFTEVNVEHEGWLSAEDAAGNELVLEYMGYNTVRISVSAAE